MTKQIIQSIPEINAILIIDDGSSNGNAIDVVQIFIKKMKRIYLHPQTKSHPNGKWVFHFDNNYYVFDDREAAMSFLWEVNNAMAIALGTPIVKSIPHKLNLDT